MNSDDFDEMRENFGKVELDVGLQALAQMFLGLRTHGLTITEAAAVVAYMVKGEPPAHGNND